MTDKDKYQLFKRYKQNEAYDKAHDILMENPAIEKYLDKEEWKNMYDYLKKGVVDLTLNLLGKSEKDIEMLNSRLERNIKKIKNKNKLK